MLSKLRLEVEAESLGEYPDLPEIQILELIIGLVERLCVVGVKPHGVCFLV